MENAAQRLIDHTRAQRNVGSARGEDTFRGQYSPGVSKWPGSSVQSLAMFLAVRPQGAQNHNSILEAKL